MTPSLLGFILAAALLPASASARPNLVLIVADDLDRNLDTIDSMPSVQRLAQRGLVISDFFVTNALCGPSRATLLRGQYAHSHEVVSNRAPSGGFDRFFRMGHEASTLATWLQGSGYRTMLVGKYVNGYPEGGSLTHVPPGWSEFLSPIDDDAYKGFRYRMNENGRIVSYGDRTKDYLTDVLARKAVELVRRTPSPFFLYLTPYAPHHPAIPAPRHDRLFAGARVPRTPSFNEADVSDKPAPRSPLSASEIDDVDALYRGRLRSMRAVDEMIEGVVNALEASGRLSDTYIVFTSDNGFHMGQHRLRPQKATPYEEDLRVPFVVKGPSSRESRSLTSSTAVPSPLCCGANVRRRHPGDRRFSWSSTRRKGSSPPRPAPLSPFSPASGLSATSTSSTGRACGRSTTSPPIPMSSRTWGAPLRPKS
jgi:arylsulfatase A-like enzyme